MNFETLIEHARQHRPDPDRPGFETRLRARIAELRRSREADAAGLFAAWLWRASLGLTPIAAALALVVFLTHGFALPADAGSVLAHLAGWLPGSL